MLVAVFYHFVPFMTSSGHFLFALSCTLVAHKVGLTPAIAQADIWHLLPASLVTALLPDIDHPQSKLGRAVPWISKPIAKVFGHRGFTHSILALALGIWGLSLSLPGTHLMAAEIKDALIIGYLSHILADSVTPAGVPFFWPLKRKYRLLLLRRTGGRQERWFCLGLLALTIAWQLNWFGVTLPSLGMGTL